MPKSPQDLAGVAKERLQQLAKEPNVFRWPYGPHLAVFWAEDAYGVTGALDTRAQEAWMQGKEIFNG